MKITIQYIWEKNQLLKSTIKSHWFINWACRRFRPAAAGKTFPAFPAYAQSVILRIWQEAHDKTSTRKETLAGRVSLLPWIVFWCWNFTSNLMRKCFKLVGCNKSWIMITFTEMLFWGLIRIVMFYALKKNPRSNPNNESDLDVVPVLNLFTGMATGSEM